MFAASKTDSVSGAAPADAQFNYVTMLLHGDGTNGAQNNTFVDSSTNNFSITRNGNTTQGSFSPYGSNWSNYFNGSSYLLLNNQLALGSGNFTIEFWINFNNVTTSQTIYDNRPYSTQGAYPTIYISSGTIRYFVSSADRITSSTVSVGSWYHIAIVRNSGTTIMYLNGVQTGSSYTDGTTYLTGANRPVIGTFDGAIGFLNGYISNLRVNNTAVYTGTFTPSTTPLAAITGTQFLTCQSNRLIDSSSNAFAITVSGTPSVQRFNPFGTSTAYSTAIIGGSGYFDGTSDWLTTPYTTANFDWWTTDFTLEAWIYPTTFAGWGYADSTFAKPVLVGNVDVSSGTNYWSFGPYTNGILVFAYYNGAAVQIAGQTLIANQWNHIAITKTASGITLFANGIGSSITALSGTPQSSASIPLSIGRGNNTNINGYVGDMRIVKGTAIYSGSTYTVPTAPLTSVANTKLLLNTTNAAITDNAMMNNLETVGNAQISTSVKKYGTGSMAFDGTGDYLSIPDNQAFNFAGDFTIEFWMYANSVTGSIGVLGKRASETNYAPFVMEFGSSTLQLYLSTSGSSWAVSALSTATLSTATWYHIAVVRSGSTVYLFVNGTSVGSTGTASGSLMINTSPITIGRTAVSPTAADFNGYIDDIRISKFARYTSNFTAPTAALSDSGPY